MKVRAEGQTGIVDWRVMSQEMFIILNVWAGKTFYED